MKITALLIFKKTKIQKKKHLFNCNGAKGNFTDFISSYCVHEQSLVRGVTFKLSRTKGQRVNPKMNTVTQIAPGRSTVSKPVT